MDWGGMDISHGALSDATATVWALSPLDVRTYFVDPTVMFSRLITSARVLAAVPAGGLLYAVGLIAWSGDPDSAALPADPPDPAQDPEADWLILNTSTAPEGTPLGTHIFPALDFMAHSRARRRLGNNTGLLLCSQVTNMLGAGIGGILNTATHVRYLLKE